jgi:hypothetical protein
MLRGFPSNRKTRNPQSTHNLSSVCCWPRRYSSLKSGARTDANPVKLQRPRHNRWLTDDLKQKFAATNKPLGIAQKKPRQQAYEKRFMIANTFQAEIQYRSGKPNWMQTEIESRRQRLMMMSEAKEKQRNLYRIVHNTPSSSSSPSSKILDATT